MRRLTVTNSEVSAFRKCPSAWGFRYAEGLVPQRAEREPGARELGTLAHAGIESGWRSGADLAGAIEAACARISGEAAALGIDDPELIASAGWAAAHSLKHTDRERITHRVIATEHQFTIPISTHLAHGGTIDLITVDPNGCLVVWDHKTTSYTLDVWESRLALDTQHIGYSWAARQLAFHMLSVDHGSPVVFRWSVVRSKRPSVPHVNKDRKVSVAAIDTLPEIYAEALDIQENERGIGRTEAQAAKLAELEARGDTFYAQHETAITADQEARWLAELRVTAARMRSALKRPEERTRTPEACSSPTSGRCDYREVCLVPAPETRALYERVADGGTTKEERLRNDE